MAKGEDSLSAAAQSKKKRIEDEPKLEDVSAKPLQLQRRRVWRACESCRRKKIKCDGCEPTCSQCAAAGSQCTWLQTKDRAALSRHYVQELEARLLHMESVFTQVAPLLEQQVQPSSAGQPNGQPAAAPDALGSAAAMLRTIAPKVEGSPSAAVPSSSASPSPPTTTTPDEEVSELFGQLALDEYGHMRWIGGSSTMSLIQSFKALTTSPLHRISPMEEDPQAPGPSVNKLYFPATVFFGKVHALPGPEDVELPDRDLADKLVEAYFSRLHFLMPVIDKPSFLHKYTFIMDNCHNLDLIRGEAPFLSLVFALFACAAGLVQDPRLNVSERPDDGGMGMFYYERALVLQYISHPSIQVAHVQCFILMSSFLCSINCLPQAWLLIGQAVRTGQDLGLHRSPRRLSISPIEKETRRKIWWGVYVLDRMLALALGRPLGINDSDCDVELPIPVDDDHLAEYFSGASMSQQPLSLMAGNISLIKLYEIGGRVLRQVYALENCKDHLEPERKAELQRLVESLDGELTKWCEDLPAAFKSSGETNEQVSMGAVLCSHYYSILTTLHRNMLPVKQDQPFTAKSTAKAVSSARSCIRLAPSMRHIVPPSHHLAFFIQHLFSSAVIVLLYAMHAPDVRAAAAAMEEAKSTLAAIEAWEGTWPGARKCKELLADLISTSTTAIAQGPREKTVNPSQTQAPSPGHERRRSVTIAAATPSSRTSKSRARRNQSRDSGPSSRRLNAVSPYRMDGGQRARSSSRKRGHDDDGLERSSTSGPYYQSFSSTSLPQSTGSNHSSPASGTLPSPSMASVEETSPQLVPTSTTSPTTFSYNNTPLSPASQVASPHRYELEYGVQPSAISGGHHWNGNNGGDQPMFSHSDYPSSSFNNWPYDPSSDIGGNGTLGSSSAFGGVGLPFRGLDFIRNYNPSGYPMAEHDALWNSYDPGAFGFDPDVAFSLGDGVSGLEDNIR